MSSGSAVFRFSEGASLRNTIVDLQHSIQVLLPTEIPLPAHLLIANSLLSEAPTESTADPKTGHCVPMLMKKSERDINDTWIRTTTGNHEIGIQRDEYL